VGLNPFPETLNGLGYRCLVSNRLCFVVPGDPDIGIPLCPSSGNKAKATYCGARITDFPLLAASGLFGPFFFSGTFFLSSTSKTSTTAPPPIREVLAPAASHFLCACSTPLTSFVNPSCSAFPFLYASPPFSLSPLLLRPTYGSLNFFVKKILPVSKQPIDVSLFQERRIPFPGSPKKFVHVLVSVFRCSILYRPSFTASLPNLPFERR